MLKEKIEEAIVREENIDSEDMEMPYEPDEWKLWLFKENIRLASKEKDLNEMKERFDKEKEQFMREMKEWSRQIQYEKTRLAQETSFFDKKFKLLENGFKQLALDKEKFAAEKRAYEYRLKFYQPEPEFAAAAGSVNEPQDSFFFKGVRNQAGLKKRYKELMKIFHPDNLGGDTETVGQISREYEKLKLYFEK